MTTETFSPGATLGDFEIVRPLGKGGMGALYVATQRGTGTLRALKVMRSGMMNDPSLRKRFEQEARVSGLIRSDHVVHVVAAGVDERTAVPFLAMELLEGADLSVYLARPEPLGPTEVALIVQQLCHALGAAHDVGVVHRDLKPENVFLSASRIVGMPFVVKVLDFGVAKILSEAKGATMAIGTPAYMAPEQSQLNGQVSPPADVWALGLLTFRLLTGRSFWRAVEHDRAEPAVLWRELLIDALPAASARAREYGVEAALPAGFDGWFGRCVTRDVAARFADANAAYQAIRGLLAPLSASTQGSLEPVAVQGALPGARADGRDPAHVSTRVADEKPPGLASLASLLASKPASLPTPERGSGERAAARIPTGKLTFRDRSGKTIVEAPLGTTLLQVSLNNALPHTHACGGHGRCTTCRVLVLDGAQNLSPRTDIEVRRATERGWAETVRLGCQARLEGDVSVRRLVVDTADERAIEAEAQSHVTPTEMHAVTLSCGIRDFAGFAAANLPHDVIHALDRYLREIGEPITANHGLIDQYQGERLLALFRTDEGPSGAIDALRACFRMLPRIKQYNQYLQKNFGGEFDVAIGLGIGRVILGEVGHPSRRQAVAIGAAWETAARMERAAHASRARVVVSEALLARVEGEVQIGRRLSADGDAGIELLDFKTPDAVFLVQSTFERLAPRADEFASVFYDKLFEIHPPAADLFDDVDMSIQRGMLMKMLAVTIRGIDQMDLLVPTLQSLGRRHVGYGAQPLHYKFVGQALIGTIEHFFEGEFTPEVHVAWMEIYGFIARNMLQGARSPESKTA